MATISHPVGLRRRISIHGIVQGVGFRPFVFQIAKRAGLSGFVFNSSSGVTIEVEGDEEALNRFMHELQDQAPPLAQIEEITSVDVAPLGPGSFEIRSSQCVEDEFVLVAPDTASCADCMREVFDPSDRRYGYLFTNCTNCGPRYTIIRDIPYDRPFTTMARFIMCPQCASEYHHPADRRFHAQPNACSQCGPTIALARSGTFVPTPAEYGFGKLALSVMSDVRQLLREGAIIAIKGLGGFQLACDATNDEAVQQLRRRKKRSDKPFALMARDVATVEDFCIVSDGDRQVLQSRERPIVVLSRRSGASISSLVAPGNHTLGVMLPYTPLHALLFGEEPSSPPEFTALVMTSGNISDEPIVTSNQEAWQRLAKVADWTLFHNRDIYMRVDDSLARSFEGKPRLLRRSRGFAPHPIDLGHHLEELLACGAELKNTFCLTKERYAILSQHIGDVENLETLEFFQETLANLKKLFRVEPRAVAHDLHPLYMTTRLAREMDLPKIGVQHHHAHIVSCMAENRLRGRVMGVALDGTGYGTDGQIWGGEFLTAGFESFERQAHIRYVPMAGGDKAVLQPWRSALSWIKETFGPQLPSDLPLWQQAPSREVKLVSQMLDRSVNTILTSSCGRLFDAVAALIGLRSTLNFEGQAAIELEMAAQSGIDEVYPFEIEGIAPMQIDFRPMICEIVRQVQRGEPKEEIAARFHNTLAEAISEVCSHIDRREHLQRVCLSGGTFQNMYLLERTVARLRQSGFEVFMHSAVPPNDGGISLGQAVIANELLRSGA
jgi:hydrogenase maturation protein HypF